MQYLAEFKGINNDIVDILNYYLEQYGWDIDINLI